MPRHKKYVQAAAEMARHSNIQFQHGCVCVHNGKIIAKGYNHHCVPVVEPINETMKRTIHAEIDTCNKVARNLLSHCSIYVVRVNSKGEIVNSQPCARCKEILTRMKVKRVYYSS